MRFIVFFFLAVVFFSSAELFLLLKFASSLGFFPTFLMCVLTGVLGGALVRSQSLQTLSDIQKSLAEGKLPAEEIVSGFMLVLTGTLLMLPGFITDTMGFLMLVPPIRRFAARKFLEMLKRNIAFKFTTFNGFQTPGTTPADDDSIEVEKVRRPASNGDSQRLPDGTDCP